MIRNYSVAVLAALSVAASIPIAQASTHEEKGPPGYSIFHDTMVDMPWQEVAKLANSETLVLFPVAVIEEHGPHKPLGTDVYLGYNQSRMLKQQLEEQGIKTIIAPPFYWGINAVTGGWPGSFTSRPSTVKAVLWDALASLKGWGFEKVVFINHHGDPLHNQVIVEAIAEARRDFGVKAYFVTNEAYAKRLDLVGRDHVLIRKSPATTAPTQEYVDPHAGRVETSRLAAYFPDLVNASMARDLPPTKVTPEQFEVWLEGWSTATEMTPEGYVGDPARFDPEEGKTENEAAVKSMANVINAFLKGNYKPGDIFK